MTLNTEKSGKTVYRLALTGGPCSGKTTGQARLSTFFENLGWKVYRVPETATVLLNGGVRFAELSSEEACKFQENLLKTMIAMEETYFALAASSKRNCLVICDRGTMDAAAFFRAGRVCSSRSVSLIESFSDDESSMALFTCSRNGEVIPKEAWNKILAKNGWNTVEIRDNRYNQVVHLITAANGAEAFYNTEDNACRTEGLELARQRDIRAAEAWVGHPYIDVIDNSTDFDMKLRRLIASVCTRIGIDTSDRLATNSHKLKFLVGSMPPDTKFPPYKDFDVVHDYLLSVNPKIQARLRKRGQNGNWSYMLTQRRCDVNSQVIEVKRQISHRDYINMLSQRDDKHYTVYKLRRCFMLNNMYVQMDIYKSPCHPRCKGLILLETYTTLKGDELKSHLPAFLDVKREVTGDPSYSMFNLSHKGDWNPNKMEPVNQCPDGSYKTIIEGC